MCDAGKNSDGEKVKCIILWTKPYIQSKIKEKDKGERENTMKVKKRILSGILTAAMFFGSLSGASFAGMMKVDAAESNVALNKPVTVSGIEKDMENCTGDKAVDGQNNGDSRWSGGYMKGNHTPKGDQWITIDLKAQATEVTSIQVAFHLKVWATKYRIETSDTSDAGWETVKSVDRAAEDNNSVTDNFLAADLEASALKRYVRFYFTELNSIAGGDAISVREITIMGTQTGAIDDISSAQEALNAVSDLTVAADDTKLSIPSVSDDYEIKVYGSEAGQVITDDGTLSPYRIGDRSFNLILTAVNKTDASDTAKKNVTVTVEGNTSKYPALFPETANPNPMPNVLPTVQEWYGYEGESRIWERTKIIVNDRANVGLSEVAEEMQADIQEICGRTLEIETGTSGSEGNIYLESLPEDVYGTGEEGYFLVNGENGIEIYSTTRTGVLYGTVTVEQILYQDPSHALVPKGVIRDYPLYGTRGIMFDIARIPTRMQFLQDYSKILKWYKLNTIQIHLNDNQWSDPAYSPDPELWKEVEGSHRLESEVFPSLAKQDSKFLKDGDNPERYEYYYSTHTGMENGGELYYTKEEYKALEEAMGKRGVKVVAELDTPGHSAAYNKYVYYNQQEAITGLVNYGYLDRDTYLNADGSVKKNFYIHNPANFELLSIDEDSTDTAVAENARNAKIFMTALFDEYLGGIDGIEPIFTTDTISAGVDEYWQKTDGTRAGFGKYINYMNDLLGKSENRAQYSKNETSYGKDVIIWGAFSQFPCSDAVSKDLTIALWNSGYEDDPIARLNEGFSLINIPQPFLYTTPGRHHKDMLNEVYVYYNWDPTKFTANISADKGEPLLKGAMGALWGDENREGITEADLHERYLRLAAMIGEKDWGGTKEGDTFLAYEQKFDRLKEGPGTQIANRIASKTNVVLDYDFENVSKDGKTVYDASGNGYHGTITGGEVVTKADTKMLKFDGNTKIETPLTTLGYPYTMSFDVYLDGDESNDKNSALFSGYDGRLQAAGLNGNLGLNRDYFTQSFDYPIASAKKQHITIVGTYQATKLYVDGKFKKILYAAASDPDHGGAIGASTWTDRDNNFRTTFVFPLNVIGENFSGYMGNIKAYNKALSAEELFTVKIDAVGSFYVDVARNRFAYADNKNPGHDTDGIRLFPAWKATDGDGHVPDTDGASVSYESQWHSSNQDDDFLMVDLGQTRKISRTVIDWEANRYADSYNIMVSLDGKNWTAVKSVTGNTSAQTTDTFDEAEARYVKMQGVKRKSGANEYAIFEMKVYSSVDKTALLQKWSEVKGVLDEKGIGWESTGADRDIYDNIVLARAVFEDEMAGQEEVDGAVARLDGAFFDWTDGSAVRNEMQQKVSESADLISKKDAYDAESFRKFEEAYNAAKNVAENLSKEEYENLLKDLDEAIKGLKEKNQDVKAAQLAAPSVTSVKSQPANVKVTWNAVSHASAYQLYRKVGSSLVKVGGAVTGTQAFDENPVGGKNMSYQVVALAGSQNAYEDSVPGAAKSIKLPNATGKVTASLVKGKKAVNLKWKKVKGASSYLVFRAEGKKAFKKIATVKKKVTYRDSKKLKKGKSYSYKIVTVSKKTYSPMKAAKKAVKIK